SLTYFSGALLLALALSLFLVNHTSPVYIVWPGDPVFSMPLRHFFWIIGGLMLAVSVVCIFDDHPIPQMSALACLATIFAVYQVGVYLKGFHSLSGYLGGFPRTFGASTHSP